MCSEDCLIWTVKRNFSKNVALRGKSFADAVRIKKSRVYSNYYITVCNGNEETMAIVEVKLQCLNC